jgi:hypothetical protein
MKFDPPRLMRGPLSGRIYVVTHGKILSHDTDRRERIQASLKYDVTAQFNALYAKSATERSKTRTET